MPYDNSWVEPETFVTHNGVTVYRVYKGGDINQGPRTYWFTLNELCGEDECVCDTAECHNEFDIRDLDGYEGGEDVDAMKAFLIQKIDAGVLTAAGVKAKETA